jgi:tetraacyldisaccharide 4'-kinase
LYVFSLIYGGLVNLRLAGYNLGIFRRKKLNCYVISLGNITVGGTGKTPTAQRLAKEIQGLGYRVVILNRGYRAKWKGDVGVVSDGQTLHMNATEAGDEAFMLAKHLPGVPVLIGPERYQTGSYAIEHFGAEVAILDDGYQHWMLERDMEILLIDAVNVFGNSYILPRGTLREPISHIDRADVCLLTKVDQATDASREYIHHIIQEENGHALVVESVHQPKGFIRFEEWAHNISSPGVDVAEMRGKRVMAVSAIGNPASFEQTLSDIGAVVIESLRFPDHHDYTVQEMLDVAAQALLLDAEAIVITEKDAVKVPVELLRERPDFTIPIYVVSVEVTFREGEEEFIRLMKSSLKEYGDHKGKNERISA